MEVSVVVLFKGALAHYRVQVKGRKEYLAELTTYKGLAENQPPHQILLRKQGRQWMSETADHQLSDDLGYAVEQKIVHPSKPNM